MGQTDNSRKPRPRIRPGWHRLVGWLTVAVGVGVIAGNDLMLLASNITLLPGGHNELYLVAGVGVAASSLWWFGWMDRTT